jgi:Flp pilus assembly protein protease CpaA
MARKNSSIGLSLIGGFVGVIFGFSGYVFRWFTEYEASVGAYFLYIGIVSLFAIFGALIEFKYLITGSFICLITGGLLIIVILIIGRVNLIFLFPFFPSFLIIVGGALGIRELRLRDPQITLKTDLI